MAKSTKQSFLHGALILTLATAIVKIIGAIYKIPITQMLTGVGMGYYSSAYTIFNVIYMLSVAGMPVAVSKLVAESVAKGRYKDARKIFRLSSVVFCITGIAGFLITFFGAGLFANLVGNSQAYLSIAAIAPAILFGCLMSTYRGYYQGLKNMYPTGISQVIEALVKLGMGLLFAYITFWLADTQFASGGMVFGIQASSLEEAKFIAMPFASAASILGVSCSTLGGFLYLFFLHKVKGDGITKQQLAESPHCYSSGRTIKRLIFIAIPICLGSIVFNLTSAIDLASVMNRLHHILDTAPEVLIAQYKDLLPAAISIPADLTQLTAAAKEDIANFLYGAYNFPMSLFNLIPSITLTFGVSVLPTITGCWTLKDYKGVKTNIDTMLRMCLLIACPAGIGLSMLSGPILGLLYGVSNPSVIIATPLLSITAITAILLSVTNPIFSVLQGIGRAQIPVLLMLIGGAIKLIINFTLVSFPDINITGAATGSLVCYAFIVVSSMIMLFRITKVIPDIISVLLKPLVSGLVCSIAAFVFYSLFSHFASNTISLLFAVALGAVFYVGMLFVLRAIKKDDVLLLPKGKKIAKLLEKFNCLG